MRKALGETIKFVADNQGLLEQAGRDLAFSLAQIYLSALMLEHAAETGKTRYAIFVFLMNLIMKKVKPVICVPDKCLRLERLDTCVM